jgi:hypothetical protein
MPPTFANCSIGYVVTLADSIDLEVGSSRWLQASPWLLGALGSFMLLTSAAVLAWKVVLLGALGLACVACVRAPRRLHLVTRLRLHADRSAILFTPNGMLPAMQAGDAWCSRWCCVVRLVDTPGGRCFRCLLCRSCNSADAYRRLLVHLRLNGAMEAG